MSNTEIKPKTVVEQHACEGVANLLPKMGPEGEGDYLMTTNHLGKTEDEYRAEIILTPFTYWGGVFCNYVREHLNDEMRKVLLQSIGDDRERKDLASKLPGVKFVDVKIVDTREPVEEPGPRIIHTTLKGTGLPLTIIDERKDPNIPIHLPEKKEEDPQPLPPEPEEKEWGKPIPDPKTPEPEKREPEKSDGMGINPEFSSELMKLDVGEAFWQNVFKSLLASPSKTTFVDWCEQLMTLGTMQKLLKYGVKMAVLPDKYDKAWLETLDLRQGELLSFEASALVRPSEFEELVARCAATVFRKMDENNDTMYEGSLHFAIFPETGILNFSYLTNAKGA